MTLVNKDRVVRVSRVNSKILKHSNTYLLFNPAANTRYRRTEIFDYIKYFSEMTQRENYPLSAPQFYLNASAPLVFCLLMGKFIDHLYTKYGARTVYYSPRLSNFYKAGVLGFIFVDAKRRLLFELQYNELREKCRAD